MVLCTARTSRAMCLLGLSIGNPSLSSVQPSEISCRLQVLFRSSRDGNRVIVILEGFLSVACTRSCILCSYICWSNNQRESAAWTQPLLAAFRLRSHVGFKPDARNLAMDDTSSIIDSESE